MVDNIVLHCQTLMKMVNVGICEKGTCIVASMSQIAEKG